MVECFIVDLCIRESVQEFACFWVYMEAWDMQVYAAETSCLDPLPPPKKSEDEKQQQQQKSPKEKVFILKESLTSNSSTQITTADFSVRPNWQSDLEENWLELLPCFGRHTGRLTRVYFLSLDIYVESVHSAE